MSLTLDVIAEWPSVIRARTMAIKERHTVLKCLDADIYDSEKPGFVSLKSLVSGTDDYFCSNVAKITKQQYYDLLRTL